MDFGKPEWPEHLFKGPMLSFGPEPEKVDLESRLASMLEATNSLHRMHMELQVAVIQLTRTLVRQPGFDRERAFSDLMDLAEEHYRSPHEDLVSPMLKTVGWYLKHG